MIAVEVFFPDMAITSTRMADQIPTTSVQETGITQPTREAPAAVAEADAPVHVPVLAQVVVAPVVVRKTLTVRSIAGANKPQNKQRQVQNSHLPLSQI